MKYPVAHNYSS